MIPDNASVHASDVVRRTRPSLARSGLNLYYLPAYAPELNRIEAVSRQIKHCGIPVRSYKTVAV